MSQRDAFLRAYEREHAITRKVLHAYPVEQGTFRPHERSSTAHQLAWTFVSEERMMLQALKGESILSGPRHQPPERWDELLRLFDEQHDEMLRVLREGDDATLEGTTQFFTAPKQVGDYRTADFLWFLLHDQIHHRGQLSVYVRMAGGKVPSIYGPSADEPWS